MKKHVMFNVCVCAAAALLAVACQHKVLNARYTVTFAVEGGGQAPMPQTVMKGGKVQTPASEPQPQDTELAFKHWALQKDGSAAYDFNAPVDADLMLYAVWGIKLTLKPENGADDVIFPAIKDAAVTSLPSAKKKNALFRYWSATPGGGPYDLSQPVTAPFTLYAVYYDIPNGQKRIYAIQGSSHTSPEKGNTVTAVPGIVTGIHYAKGKADGFYMQDADGDDKPVTSDGIYVYCKDKMPDGLKVKDAVTVSGKVEEFAYTGELSKTQIKITEKTDVVMLSSDNALPEPVEMTAGKLEKKVFKGKLEVLDPDNEAIDYYESLESMRVTVCNPKVVAAPYRDTQYIVPAQAKGASARGGLVYNSYDSTARICLYPYSCFSNKSEANVADPEPVIGDSYRGDVTGVLGYAYGNYRIDITEKLPELVRANIQPEVSAITFDAGALNLVSYNLENFSFESKMQQYNANTKTWGAPHLHASGLTSEKRAEVFAEHLIHEMKAPDVICLIEIQDDNSGSSDTETVSAEKTLKLLIDKIRALDSTKLYKAVNIDPQKSAKPEQSVDGGAPGANIRCCYLYRDDRIELVPDSDNDWYNSDFNTKAELEAGGMKLKQNPARIGVGDASFDQCRKSLVAHFTFKNGINGGKDFFVINNHLTSKRGDGKIWGDPQPVVRGSEANRWLQAQALTAFITDVKNKRPDARIISVGDYNDFWFSQTIDNVKAAGMKNAIEALPENERYTYVYDGHSQTLDNILVTGNIAIIYADVLHLNSEFSPKKRVSDHDPVFVQLRF